MYVYMSVSEIGSLGVAKGQPNVPVSMDFGILVASVYNSIHYPFQTQKGLKTNKQTKTPSSAEGRWSDFWRTVLV